MADQLNTEEDEDVKGEMLELVDEDETEVEDTEDGGAVIRLKD